MRVQCACMGGGCKPHIGALASEKGSVSSPYMVGKGCDSVRVVRVQNNALLKGASTIRLGCCAQAAAVR